MLYTHLIFTAALARLASAYTTPTNATWGALLTPDKNDPVTQGNPFKVTWDPTGHPTDGVTVSLVLCTGPSSSCIPQDTSIAEDIPAGQKSFNWNVPCSLPVGTQSTASGYGMLIIVDGTGEFQYSTQFSVKENSACSGSSGNASASTAATTSANGSSATSSASSTTLSGTAFRNATSTITSSSSSGRGSTVTTGAATTTPASTSSASATQSTNDGSVKVASAAAVAGIAAIAAIAAAMFAL